MNEINYPILESNYRNIQDFYLFSFYLKPYRARTEAPEHVCECLFIYFVLSQHIHPSPKKLLLASPGFATKIK